MQDPQILPQRVVNDICAASGLTDQQKFAIYAKILKEQTIEIDTAIAPIDVQAKFLARSAFCESIIITTYTAIADELGIGNQTAMEILSIAHDRAGVSFFVNLLNSPEVAAWPEKKRYEAMRAIIETVLFSSNTTNIYNVPMTVRDVRALSRIVEVATPFLAPPITTLGNNITCLGHLLLAFTCTPVVARTKYINAFNTLELITAHQLVVPIFTDPTISQATRSTFIQAATLLRKKLLWPFFAAIVDALAQTPTCMAAFADILAAVPYAAWIEATPDTAAWDSLFAIEHTRAPVSSRFF